MVKVSDFDVEGAPGVVAVISSVYRPGLSFLLDVRRPWKPTVFTPAWPVMPSVPATTLCVHLRFFLLRPVCATHLPATSRPDFAWVKAKLTLADVLRLNLNVVPTGGLRARLICASLLPSRHLLADCVAFERTGATSRGGLQQVVGGVAGVGVVGTTGWNAAIGFVEDVQAGE